MTLNPVDDALRARLRAALPDTAFRDPEPRYLEEPRGKWQGKAGLVLAPGSTGDVSQIVQIANENRTAVIPYGGGTGLVGGQIAPDIPAPIVLSLERMTAIRAIHADENTLTVEAGATLSAIHEEAERHDRIFPLSYASEGSARIGGALSVNSGGINVLRYGTARDLCLGIEAVLPDGSIHHGLKRLRKDNTGYDIRNLLIGAEGTLGIITAATLRLFPRPRARATALLTVPSPAAALALFHRANALTGALSAFELIAGQGPRFIEEAALGIPIILDPIPDWSVLLEIAPTGSEDPEALLETLFTEAHNAGDVTDGILAASESQRQDLWHLRESIPEANRKIGAIASHDISLPLSRIPGFLDEAPKRLAKIADIRINAFGHLGDGNLHYNCFASEGRSREEFADRAGDLTRTIHDLVHEMDGSFSAEHGIGRLKVDDLERYGDSAKLRTMRLIKKALDPNGIMNPGAVLRRE